MTTKLAIVGARFRPPAQAILDLLAAGTPLIVRRQPDNPYDENALQVLLKVLKETTTGSLEWDEHLPEPVRSEIEEYFTDDGLSDIPEQLHLGYVPREDAAIYSPMMDSKGISELPATLSFSLSGGPMVALDVSVLLGATV